MRILLKLSVALLLAIVAPNNSKAQKLFQGRIFYELSYEGAGLNESIKSMLPKEMTLSLKNNKSRSELKTGMGDQITIFDGESKSVINLLDIMGQKVAIKKSTEEIDRERNKYTDLKITLSKETKQIAGYNCKKALIEVNSADFNGKQNFTVFYTDELGNKGVNYSDPLFNKIEGVMLQYELNARGLLMKFMATEVKTEALSDDEFSVPGNYKEMTQDELKKMFGNR